MVTDFSRNYTPPGIYTDENESVVVSSLGSAANLVALVGQTRGYQVHVEQAVFGDPITLVNKGIDFNSLVVTLAADGSEVDTGDYVLAKVSDNGNQDYYTSFTPASGADTADGTTIFLEYHYTDPDYFNPKRVESFEDVKDLYGEPMNLASGSPSDANYSYIPSPLSLAAKVAFENGATELVLCAATPPGSGATNDAQKSTARRSALAVAYGKTATLPSVTVIVGVATGILTSDAPGALTDLSNHLDAAAGDGFTRFGLIGFDTAVSTAPDTLISTAAARNRRMALAYVGPSGLLMYSGGTNSTFKVSHAYFAAACAGRMSALPVHRSLTKQAISSFVGLGGTPMSNALKNQYSAAGVMVGEIDRLGRLVVRHGVTTDPSNVNTREAAVVRAKDYLIRSIEDGFTASDLIGQPVNDEMLYTIKSAMQGYLETAVANDTIVSYTGLAVRQGTTDPTVVEVKFAYKPAYPLNFISVSFSIDMTTGTTTDLATAA